MNEIVEVVILYVCIGAMLLPIVVLYMHFLVELLR